MTTWPDIEDNYGENEVMTLMRVVEGDWDWQWPGWAWVAKRVNREHGQKRSPSACRHKYIRELKATKSWAEAPV